MNRRHFLSLGALWLGAAACRPKADPNAQPVLRVGHFPNITHAHGVIAHELSRQGKGWFEERLPGTKIDWFVYNAGPSAIEAILAGSLDLTYIGPNPVLNGYVKTKGTEIRVFSGATSGGAALVVQGEGGPTTPAEFRGKKIATPQLGNTQDVACRVWLGKNGIKVSQIGGEASILPTANPDQLTLFQQKKLDAVWTVEPWVSRLELEAGGKVFLEQKDEFATVLAGSVEAAEQKTELVKQFVKAHRDLTVWIKANEVEAKALLRSGIKELTKRELPEKLADKAWPRLVFNDEVTQSSFEKVLAEAQSVDLLPKDAPSLDKLLAVPAL